MTARRERIHSESQDRAEADGLVERTDPLRNRLAHRGTRGLGIRPGDELRRFDLRPAPRDQIDDLRGAVGEGLIVGRVLFEERLRHPEPRAARQRPARFRLRKAPRQIRVDQRVLRVGEVKLYIGGEQLAKPLRQVVGPAGGHREMHPELAADVRQALDPGRELRDGAGEIGPLVDEDDQIRMRPSREGHPVAAEVLGGDQAVFAEQPFALLDDLVSPLQHGHRRLGFVVADDTPHVRQPLQ